jgi:hypothetical protein
MFVGSKGIGYTYVDGDRHYTKRQGYQYRIVDTDFEEIALAERKDNGTTYDIITPMVKCYERRTLPVAKNMMLYIRQIMQGNPLITLDRVMNAHPELAKYREDIEKLLLLM